MVLHERQQATVYVKDLDTFVTVQLLKDFSSRNSAKNMSIRMIRKPITKLV